MGMNVEATLAYGYDLGSMEDFRAVQRGEYDSPDLPWFDPDDEDASFPDEAEKVLFASVGFTEEWTPASKDNGYYDRKKAAEQQIGVDFDYAGSHDYPAFVLYATGSKQSVDWAQTMTLDPNELMAPRPGWDAKLTAALASLGITPTQAGPRWLVFPFYG
ncbi:hypothetical protein ACQP2Y_20970 [Actinoplanes sp. CA-051413]|uniref:hypothetical protein n=1 Tax=Actinoplanes sp. CA-051413 TaxID=3239899 RepID=UPI003D97287E